MRKDSISMAHRKNITLPPQQMPPAGPAPHQQMTLPPQQMPPAPQGVPPEANQPWPDPEGGVYTGKVPQEAYQQWTGKSVQGGGDLQAMKMDEMRAMIKQRILDQRNGRHITEDQVLGLNPAEDGYYLQIGEEGEPREVFFKDVM